MAQNRFALLPPLRDSQSLPPSSLCPRCGGELYPGEFRFLWSGLAVCCDCFRSLAGNWLERFPVEAARVMQVPVLPPEGGVAHDSDGACCGIS